MASDDTADRADPGQARATLEAVDRAGERGRRAARRWARRYLLGFGAVSAGSVLAVWLLSPWVSQTLWGVWYAALAAVLAMRYRRQPVRAVPRALLFALIGAWAVVFGMTMAIAPEYPVAYPVGAGLGFAVWAAGAWWAGR